MASTMPAPTPTATTTAAVIVASANSAGLSRRMSRRPRRSTRPMAMVKTMAPSTQRGRDWGGPVGKRREGPAGAAAARRDEVGKLTSAARALHHGRLGRAPVDHEGAAYRRRHVGRGESGQVGVLVELIAMPEGVGPSGGRALGHDQDET